MTDSRFWRCPKCRRLVPDLSDECGCDAAAPSRPTLDWAATFSSFLDSNGLPDDAERVRGVAALLAAPPSPDVGEAARVLLADLRAPYGEDCGLWLEVIPAMEREYHASGGHMGAALRAALARLSAEEGR